jgi:ribosomal protein S18 acetylase RimI-like enzyme
MRDFRFSNEHSSGLHEGAIDVLSRPRLWIPEDDYPDYYEWLEKVEAQLEDGRKRAMVAYSGRQAVGAIVYQRHEANLDTVEIKNISVQPDMRGRYVGSFLLSNTAVAATGYDFPECDRLMVDTKISNTDMINFLIRHGYTITEICDLYYLGAGDDAVMTKSITP